MALAIRQDRPACARLAMLPGTRALDLIQINCPWNGILHAGIPDTERAAMTDLVSPPQQVYPFDARGIGRRFRHAAIFGALDALQPGETMRFCNDHDPLPLLAQLQARYGEHVGIEYKQREPGAIVIDFKVLG